MIIATRKAIEEETEWTKAENRVKTWIYNMMHELVQSQVFNSLIYRLLIVVETLQFLWYSIHPHFNFLWSVEVVNWLREFLRVLQFDGFLTERRSDSKNIFIVILYIVFAIQVIITIIIIANIWFNSARRKISTIMAYSIKTLGGYMLLLNTILTLPFFYIFMAAFICRANDPVHGDVECYQSTYFIHLVAALIGTILLIPTTLLAAVLCIDLNPWSPTPFAAPRSRLILLKLAMKIALPIFFIIDYEANAAKEFLIVYTVFWLLMLILRYRQTPCYKFSVFNLILAMEMLLFWISLVSVFHAFIDNLPIDNIGFLFLWVGAPFIIFTYAAMVNKRRKIYRKVTVKSLKKDSEVEMYILNIISLIESRKNVRKRMTLEGLLKFHMKTCTNKEFGCVCYSLHTDYLREQDAPEKIWYLWVKAITLEGIAKFPKSSRLHMLYAYVQREKLHNKFKALFEIMFAHNNKPTIEEEFSIYRYKNLIEEEMIESDMKIAENKGVNVNVIVDFENKFVDFQGVIGAAVDLHLDFWRELQETNPEIQKLQGLGSLITKSVEEVTRHYHNLTLINPNHVKMLKVYGNFLHDIINDEAEGQKILDKAEYNNRSAMVNRQFLDNERIKYGDNANTCIITISGEMTTMGIITNTNNEITRILGFNKSEMIGQNISTIMPKFLMEIHDSFMQNYFESSDAKVIAIERIVFPIDKDGYIVPCTLMAKVLPNLDDGLKLVGFIKEIDKNLAKDQEGEIGGEEEEAHYVMYDSNTGVIHGITHGCKTDFGIPASLVRNADVAMDEFTVDQIFPELPQINIDDLKSTGGIVTTLDTSSLAQDFMIEKEGSEASRLNDSGENEKKYRKTKVKISLFQDDEYGNISLKVLKIVEILEGDHVLAKHKEEREDGDKDEEFVKVRPGEKRSGDDYERSQLEQGSEIESNANNELNDEIRDLKEFKAMISEKTVPKSIRMLRNAVVVIYLLMLGLVCLSLAFFAVLVNDFEDGKLTVSDGYRRHDYIAEINYRLRKLQVLASDLITTDAAEKAELEVPIRAAESALIDKLRIVTLNISDYQEELKTHGFGSIETESVITQSLLQTSIRNTTVSFSDAMSQYISHATSANSAPLASFVSASVTDSTNASFYFVKRNGLGPLRTKSESNAGLFADFYLDRIESYDFKFKMIMIGLIILIALSELVLIPIIFSVHKTATKVLSLFGYIPLNEINYLSTKCERYVQRYLENYRAQQSYGFEDGEENHDRPSKTSRMGDHTYVEVNQNQESQGPEQADVNASYLVEMSLEDSVRKVNGLRVPETQMMKQVSVSPATKGPMDHSSLKPMKDDYNLTSNNLITSPNVDQEQKPREREDERKGYAQDNEEDPDLGNDRPQKLLNSRDNTKSKVTIQLCFIGLLFVAYFVVNYVVETTSLDKIQSSFTHLQMISQRMPNIRFINAFTLELIAEKDPSIVFTYPGQNYTDYRIDYQNRALANNNNLKDSGLSSLPGDFDSYVSLFNLYGGGNLCTEYYGYDADLQAECLQIAGGLLTRGLTLSITRIVQLSNDLITLFDSTAKDSAGQTLVLTDEKFSQAENLVDMISPVIDASRDKFLVCFTDYLNYTWVVARVRFGVFVSLALLAFIAIWIPYLDSLKDKIFRTKGMLNMIPMELIAKNANLRSLFVNSGDILQAVK